MASYRSLWHLPAVDPNAPTINIVGPTSRINVNTALRILKQARTNQAAGTGARAGSSAARRTLLDGVADVLNTQGTPERADGDARLTNLESRANTPPIPSSLHAYPTLGPPYFDRAAGATHTFAMNLYYDDVIDALAGAYFNHYTWSVIRVPDDQWKNVDATAANMAKKGSVDGLGTTLRQRMGRQLDYAAADGARIMGAVGNLEATLGMRSAGAATLVGASRALAMVGSVVSTFIDHITAANNEQHIPLSSPGLYVVRCVANRLSNTPDAQRIHASSVAWLPVWVRKPSDMAAERVEQELLARGRAQTRLAEIAAALTNPSLPESERTPLLAESRQLRQALSSSIDDHLTQEHKLLSERLAQIDAGEQTPSHPGEVQQLRDRIADIKAIVKRRKKEHATLTKQGKEGPTRIPAVFASRKGDTVALRLEAFEVSKGDRFRYQIADSTRKDFHVAVGAYRATREDAIESAVKTRLEEHDAYGRGYATIHIPPPAGHATTAATSNNVRQMIRTIEIHADGAAIALEGVEAVANIMSMAAAIAAPLTAGTSLIFMLPAGGLSALASTYRVVDKGLSGNLNVDMATAMDIVNIVGGAAGLGQMGAGLRAMRLKDAFMMVGFGADGAGIAIAQTMFIQELENIRVNHPNAPEGVRRAMVMKLVGQKLLDAGLHIGATLGRRADHMRARAETAARGIALPRVDQATQATLNKIVGSNIPAYINDQLAPNTAHIRFRKDGYGLVIDVHLVRAKRVDNSTLTKQADIARTMQAFVKPQQTVRDLLDRLESVGAMREVSPRTRSEHLTRNMRALARELVDIQSRTARGALTPKAASAKLADARKRLAAYQRNIADLTASDRKARAMSTTQKAIRAGYPTPPADHYYLARAGGFELVQAPGSTTSPKRLVQTDRGWRIELEPTSGARATRDYLERAHPDHQFALDPRGGEFLDVNGVTVHTKFLSALGGRGLSTLLTATAQLQTAGGDLAHVRKSHRQFLRRHNLIGDRVRTSRTAVTIDSHRNLAKQIRANADTLARGHSGTRLALRTDRRPRESVTPDGHIRLVFRARRAGKTRTAVVLVTTDGRASLVRGGARTPRSRLDKLKTDADAARTDARNALRRARDASQAVYSLPFGSTEFWRAIIDFAKAKLRQGWRAVQIVAEVIRGRRRQNQPELSPNQRALLRGAVDQAQSELATESNKQPAKPAPRVAPVAGDTALYRQRRQRLHDGKTTTVAAYTTQAQPDRSTSWIPERRALHDRLIKQALRDARAFADADTGTATIYAMRGNTAVGKTRAIDGNVPELQAPAAATKHLRHRAVNPDNFKVDLMEADPDVALTSNQVHEESSILAKRLQRELANLKRSDGTLGSIMIDKRLGDVENVADLIALARKTGRKLVVTDVDAPLEFSLAGVLERPVGGKDPIPPFEAVADRGFKPARQHRQAVMALFENNPDIGTYRLFATSQSGAKVLVAEVQEGRRIVHQQDELTRLSREPQDQDITMLRSTRITKTLIFEMTRSLPPKFAERRRKALLPYIGMTWGQAIKKHTNTTSRLRDSQ